MTTSSTISPFPIVQQGDRNHPVKTLQYLLRERGHSVDVDGIFGPATDAAVRAFQQEKNLAVDGDVGGPVDRQVDAERVELGAFAAAVAATRSVAYKRSSISARESPARDCRSTASSDRRQTRQ